MSKERCGVCHYPLAIVKHHGLCDLLAREAMWRGTRPNAETRELAARIPLGDRVVL